MISENKKYTFLMVFLFMTVSTLAEFFLSYLFGEYAIQNVLSKIAFYAVAAIACLIIWFFGIKIMHLDAKGPVPWYASPVLWLSPLLVITLILMFRGGV